MDPYPLVAALAYRVLGDRGVTGVARAGVLLDYLARHALGILASASADRALGRQAHLLAASDLGVWRRLSGALRNGRCDVVDRPARLQASRSHMKLTIVVGIGLADSPYTVGPDL